MDLKQRLSDMLVQAGLPPLSDLCIVEAEIIVEPDETPVRGNALASGDQKTDRRAEDAIFRRLRAGDVWAWCCVQVRVKLVQGDSTLLASSSEWLGCCSYRNEEDFRRPGGYYDDMISECLGKVLMSFKASRQIANSPKPKLSRQTIEAQEAEIAKVAGGWISGVIMSDDGLDSVMGFSVVKDGKTYNAWIQKAAEGNGPGWLSVEREAPDL